MNGYEFFIHIIEAIAWPVALVVVAFYLRKELPTIVAGVKRVKFGKRSIQPMVARTAELVNDSDSQQRSQSCKPDNQEEAINSGMP